MTHYHVKIQNTGKAARVIHDGVSQKPIRIEAGATVEDVLDEATINRLGSERVADPDEPMLVLTRGEKVAESATPQPPHAPPQAADVAEETASQHKRRPPHG